MDELGSGGGVTGLLDRGECGCPDLGEDWEYWTGSDVEVEEILERASRLEGENRIQSLFDDNTMLDGKYAGGYQFGHSRLAQLGRSRTTRRAVCRGCYQEFSPRHPRHKFCTVQCRPPKRAPTILTCTGCSRKFGRVIYSSSASTGGSYCSRACFAARRPVPSAAARAAGYPVLGLPRSSVCQNCHATFQPYYLTQECCGVICARELEGIRVRDRVEQVKAANSMSSRCHIGKNHPQWGGVSGAIAFEARLRDLWGQGAPVSQVVADLGLSYYAIRVWIKKLGLPARKGGRRRRDGNRR